MGEHRVVELAVYAKGTREDALPYVESWSVRDDRYCPVCGRSPVCEAGEEGECDAGPDWLCPACGALYNLSICHPKRIICEKRVSLLREVLAPAEEG